jgi:ergothioneine biosynthesis protein EgtB
MVSRRQAFNDGRTHMTIAEIGPERRASDSLVERFRSVRSFTVTLTEPLAPEDFVVQSMPDVSPTKWHLAHTSWFFETFVLDGPPFHPRYGHLFNSYYNGVGAQFPRSKRGLLSRPTVAEVFAYRAHVDEAVVRALKAGASAETRARVELGLHHEQQHQELLLTDIKHVLAQNPLGPSYRAATVTPSMATPLDFVAFEGGIVEIGHSGDGFSFDNERPRHRVLLEPFLLADRLVTVGEYREFIADHGYARPDLWLSEGWDWKVRENAAAPLYWNEGGAFTLAGERPLNDAEPVVHVSLYEADAYARWSGARLPREAELELALEGQPVRGNFVERGALHPTPAPSQPGVRQLFGDGWEWTQSSYGGYPGYAPPPGAIGEYNGKFMCNQHVLRGGSCVSPESHLRASYRNFFPAHARWQFTCIRLAKDAP